VAGMLHAITLLFILIFAAQLATYIPLCILAGILIVVSYHMGEWKEIPKILKLGKADISVWLITLLLTVFADLTVAVQFGMVLAALFYIYKVTISTTILEVTPEYIQAGLEHSLQNHTVPREIRIFKINGPFLFGGTDKLSFIKQNIKDLPKIIILQTRNMTAIDATGLNALEDLANYLQAADRVLIICGMREQPANLMTKASFHHHVGDNNIQPNLKMAIQRANELLRSEAFSGKPK
jgi:sulfate permease, SulP family